MRIAVIVALVVAVSVPPPALAQPAADAGGHWAGDRIIALVRRNIVDLFPDGTFRPDLPLVRSEFVKWLVTAVGLPPRAVPSPSFVDVPLSHPLFAYVEAAVAFGLIPRAPLFLPAADVIRVDAVALAVNALGYGFEAAAMAADPLPYDDTGVLSDLQRGAVAAAIATEPPLLFEPVALSLRPLDPMTRGEAANLLFAVVQGIEQGIRLRRSAAIGAGVELTVEKRGVLHALPVWRVQIGAFATEDNARRLADSIRGRGLPVFVDFEDGFHKVRVGSFATALEAALAKEQLAAEGYPTWVIQTLPSFEAVGGPFRTAALVLDPKAARLAVAAGDGQRLRRLRTSELAGRAGALAAVNGGFFGNNGDPLGCLVVAGILLSEPDPQRSCAALTADGVLLVDRVRLEAAVSTPYGGIEIAGVNRGRGTDELILYRLPFDATTRTNAFGAEAIVTGGAVTAVGDLRGNSPIPAGGFVLSGHGRARRWIVDTLAIGTPVSVIARFAPASGDTRWDHVVQAVGGGPRLLAGGEIAGNETFPPTITERRHPRTAIGVLPDGRILLLVVDGRQPVHSLGMTILELAMELKRLGAVEAMNLDGGGSSTMVVGGRVVNLPSDEGGERPVTSVLVVLPPQSP